MSDKISIRSEEAMRNPAVEQVLEAGAVDVAETERRWRRAAWFAVATLAIGAPMLEPVLRYLPAGSAERGAVLVLVPLIGIAALGKRQAPSLSNLRFPFLLLAVVLLLQSFSAITNLGSQYEVHILPALALLALAVAGRPALPSLTVQELRRLLRAPVVPFGAMLALSWIVQLAHLVPSLYPSPFIISVHGHRLQGLGLHPDGFGFAAAMITVLAFCALPSRMIWAVRFVSLMTVLGTDSRTAFLATGVGLMLYWLFGPARGLDKRLAAVLFACAATPLAWLYVDIHRKSGSGSADVLSGRAVIWHNAVQLLPTVGWLGDGPETVARLFPAIGGVGSNIPEAQNQWLNDVLNFGYVTTGLLFVFLLALLASRLVKNYRLLVIVPLVGMILLESMSEVPIDFWLSTVEAFPIFLLIMMCPREAFAVVPPLDRQSARPREFEGVVPSSAL